MRHALLPLLFIAFLGVASITHAADDPSIEEPIRGQIQASMQQWIERATIDGVFRYYDPVDDKVVALSDVNLHAGIVRKGAYYVSCADFTDASGRKVDVDFLVLPDGDGVRTVQALLHKVDGVKRPYTLEP